jgi:predicted nucleic acid-binding protein
MPTNFFLIDTSAWILALRKTFVSAVKERIDHALKDDEVLTTGLIKLEILGGAKTEVEYKRLKSRLDALDSVATDDALWQSACDLAFTLRRKGVTVPSTDILIAACALQAKATLIHADNHFDFIAKHSSLKVESFIHVIGRGVAD